MKSVINSYRLQPGPPPTIAGRIVPVAPPTSYRRAVVILAALLLPLLAVGVVIYAARTVQPRETPAAAPVVTEPTALIIERVVEVQVIVTATPAPDVAQAAQVQAAPVQVAPRQVAPQVQALPQAPRQAPPAPQAQPRAANVQRPASVQVQAAPTVRPTATLHERILSRNCQYPDAPQGTVIKGYYTDASGIKRDAVCRVDGWKAVD